jgi:hypothetical protein
VIQFRRQALANASTPNKATSVFSRSLAPPPRNLHRKDSKCQKKRDRGRTCRVPLTQYLQYSQGQEQQLHTEKGLDRITSQKKTKQNKKRSDDLVLLKLGDTIQKRLRPSYGFVGANSPATARSCNSQGDAPALRADKHLVRIDIRQL